MGILRADRITGLGGANAIKGSVFFPHDGTATTTSGVLQVQNENDALTFGTGDFTIEFWFYTNRIGVTQHLYDGRGTGAGSNAAVLIQISDSNNIRFYTTSNYRITGSSTLKANTWYHVALTRTGSTHTLYVDGSSDGTYSGSLTYTGPTNGFSAIGSDDNGAGAYGLNGYISNLRITKELIYSGAFTVPTTELAPTPNTTLLCCQSPGNAQASFGGLTLTSFAASTNSRGPEASRFTPNSPVGFSTTTDVGSQYGSNFDGFGSFATSTYMVPPAGNTRERNRGRGIFHGGYVGPSPGNSYNAQLAAISIQSQGSFTIFGDLTQARYTTTTVGSSTRSIFAGGAIATPSPFASVNTMDFVTIANSSNATDFGDTTSTGFAKSAVSSSTRGVITGGRPYTPSAGNALNTLDLVTIATIGNATDFGDINGPAGEGGRFTMPNTAMSPTRGLFAGGKHNSPTDYVNTIELITMATLGDTTDFGDLIVKGGRSSGNCSSNTRGVFSISNYPSSDSITLEFVTIASTGNATDFGDHATATTTKGALSDTIRGLFYGGFSPAISGTYQNIVDQITIATTGNAVDWGDVQLSTGTGRGAYASGISDSHGGLE